MEKVAKNPVEKIASNPVTSVAVMVFSALNKHFRLDGVRDKQEPSLGQMGPLPGTKWDSSLGQTGLSLFNSTVKSPFCPVCPWDDCPAGAVRKMFMCFLFIGFFLPIYLKFGGSLEMCPGFSRFYLLSPVKNQNFWPFSHDQFWLRFLGNVIETPV